MRASLLLFLLALAARPGAAQSTATYQVTFESTWSAATHPDGFPSNPHFSGLVGATHDASASLWRPGALASDGIESMAETGSQTLLLAEVDALIAAGAAEFALSGPGMAVSPGQVTHTFSVTETHARVTLVTMLAPSPDWFVGVDGLDLRGAGDWAPTLDIPLYVYDAGTDSGTTYTAPNQDTQPPEPIAAIDGPPFEVGGSVAPVGSFTFLLLSTTATEAPPSGRGLALDAPFPNPVRGLATVTVRLDTPQSLVVDVVDALGRRVATLQDGPLAAGAHRRALDTRALAAGVYLVRARTRDGVVTRSLVVQR